MKQFQRMFIWLMAGVTLSMVSNLTAQTSQERSVQVVRVKGHARISPGNNVWTPVKAGTMIKAGDIIQTAADSYVDILLGDGASGTQRVIASQVTAYQTKAEQDTIRVYPDSVLGFDKVTKMRTGADDVTDTQLDLRAGKILGSVKKMSAASRYEIKLPNGVAGVRGTIFVISAAGVIQVWSGSVVVSWTGADGKAMTQLIGPGYQFDLRTLQLAPLNEKMPPIPRGVGLSIREVTIDQTNYYVSPRVPSSSTPTEEPPVEE